MRKLRVAMVWILTLIGGLYLLGDLSKDAPQKEMFCQDTQNSISSTVLHQKSDDESKKLPDDDQSVNKDLLVCIKSLASARRMEDDQHPGLQNYHKRFWPPKATERDHGYKGSGVVIDKNSLDDREKQILEKGYKTYKVNQLATDRIPLRREIHGDMPECDSLLYDVDSLPRVGVVVIFHNELWSVLLRTVFSVLDAGPDELITEIILVDDFSDKEHLGRSLDDYLSVFNDRVKLVRLPQRMGVSQARMAGFDLVTGEAAVFLDAHCEVHKGWLEPLLHRIKEDKSVLAVPVLNLIKGETFEFVFNDNNHIGRGGFDFDMHFNWLRNDKLAQNRKDLVAPLRSPTHAGCCFAVYKDTFERLDGYDPELGMWGCENLELSFKTWMCGGSVEIIPCSHVGHMYRTAFPYNLGPEFQQTLTRNCIRVAEVWLDEYKQIFYERISQIQKKKDIGDLSDRHALRKELKCRSFDWYVKKIYPELYLPLNTTATGMIYSVADKNTCLVSDMHGLRDEDLSPNDCIPGDNTQHFILSKESQIRRDQFCLSLDKNRVKVISVECGEDNSKWSYTKDNNIVHLESGLCLTLSEDFTSVMMAGCRRGNKLQQWTWPRKSVVLFK